MEGPVRSLHDAGSSLVADPLATSDRKMLSNPALKAVTNELVARLAKRLPKRLDTAPVRDVPLDAEIETFCDALISPDARSAMDFFEVLRARNITADSLCLGYIAQAARRLGERWVSDECGFLEVTLGSARLHGFLRSLHSDFIPVFRQPALRHTALFSASPGETHVLGITIAADFFRRAGWTVDLNTSHELEILCAQAATGSYDLIGLSAGCETGSELLKDTVQRLRDAQPDAIVVLGGHLTEIDPQIADRVGADLILRDVTTAPLVLQRMVATALNH